MPSIRVVQQTRRGKGNALACGFAAASGDIIVTFDADGSADPQEIPRFVEALRSGADFAKGSRFRDGGGSDDLTRFRRCGNYGLNLLTNLLIGARYTDLCYGYNGFWSDVVPYFDLPQVSLCDPDAALLRGDGFEVETLINCRIAAAGLTIVEVPSFEKSRIFGTSNLRALSDGFRVLRTITAELRRARTLRPDVTTTELAGPVTELAQGTA
jgi:glycosyltransferase involved in cell wall biosynthesis